MYLKEEQIFTVEQSVGIERLPTNHPSHSALEEAFGSHTFFVNDRGVSVFQDEQRADSTQPVARLVLLAEWSNDEFTELLPYQAPQPTQFVLDLASGNVMEEQQGSFASIFKDNDN